MVYFILERYKFGEDTVMTDYRDDFEDDLRESEEEERRERNRQVRRAKENEKKNNLTKLYILGGELALVVILIIVLLVVVKQGKAKKAENATKTTPKQVEKTVEGLDQIDKTDKKITVGSDTDSTAAPTVGESQTALTDESTAPSEGTVNEADTAEASEQTTAAADTAVPGTDTAAGQTADSSDTSTATVASNVSTSTNANHAASAEHITVTGTGAKAVYSSVGLVSNASCLIERDYTDAPYSSILRDADLRANMYDYDKAIELVKGYSGHESIPELTSAIAEYEALKSRCVVWKNNTEITHIFVHSLIVDTARAFGRGSSQPDGYNKYMTTVLEFNRMLEQIYQKGYVLVSMHDIAKVQTNADGTQVLVKNDILLPEGKIPFVLSQDDVNYYYYMEGDGFADCIVVGDDGIPTCQYTDTDGTVYYGEYDVLPIVDRFVKEHPDFSYRGAKGIIAVTGYEGALGYDTGTTSRYKDNPTSESKRAELIQIATKVADAIKADGWDFACHSYTHTSFETNTPSKIEYDLAKWDREVAPIVGKTDILLYPFGADICSWRGYEGEKYDIVKKHGYWYFCNVDSAQFWIQLRDGYMRMGRINTDGERFVKTPEKLKFMFDVDYVYDTSRPKLGEEFNY